MNGVTGYVLAGGRSSRMGRDKATLVLVGRLLIERAAGKLRTVADRVCIAGTRPDLEGYAEIVPDLREGCGPMGGAEAALLHAETEWVLLLAVDMPFVPAGLLQWLIDGVRAREGVRVAMCMVDGYPQPAVCLMHRDMAASVREALNASRLRFFPALKEAAQELALRSHLTEGEVLWMPGIEASMEERVTAAEWQGRRYWFANLNTPGEFSEAEQALMGRD